MLHNKDTLTSRLRAKTMTEIGSPELSMPALGIDFLAPEAVWINTLRRHLCGDWSQS